MKQTGNIRKMQTNNTAATVVYQLPIGEEKITLNPLIGKPLHFSFTGKINCIHCGKKTAKSYSQGYCYQCFSTLPQTDVGILHPEKDRSFLGISRDMEWSEKNSLIPHVVYLSLTDKVKVGVTRGTQIPTRWIDQGATQAIRLAETPNRHIAGTIEVYLKQYFADKTSWQQMLTQNSLPMFDLQEEKQRAKELLHAEFQQYITDDNTITHLTFPLQKIPVKVSSIKLDKTPDFTKTLTGIKGQYLLFSDDTVLNIRNHGGYEVEIEV